MSRSTRARNLAAVGRSFTAGAVVESIRILATRYRNTHCKGVTYAQQHTSPMGVVDMRSVWVKPNTSQSRLKDAGLVALDRMLNCHPRTACAAVVEHGTIRFDVAKADHQSVAVEKAHASIEKKRFHLRYTRTAPPHRA